MPDSTLAHFPIRTGPLASTPVVVSIHSSISLHGVPGFALHRHHSRPGIWTVSHIETGAECGTGRTTTAAIYDAIIKSSDRAGVYAGIARTKEQLEILGVKL